MLTFIPCGARIIQDTALGVNVSYQAIAFDLGGVIIDSELLHEQAARIVANDRGLRISEQDWFRIHGAAYENFFAYLPSIGNDLHNEECVRACIRDAYRWYYRLVKKYAKLYDGAIDVLETARSAYPFVALTTSVEWPLVQVVFRKFRKYRLESFFDHVVSGSQVLLTKPFPEPYLVTASYFGVKPRDMVVVEDSYVGLRSAFLAGVHARIYISTKHDALTPRGDASPVVTRKMSRLPVYTVTDHVELEVLLRLGFETNYGGSD